MKTNRLIWTLGWITMGSLAALQGCGGDDDDGGDSSGGKGGEAGEETGGTSSGGSPTGGRGGTTSGGTTSGGTTSGGTSSGGGGGAPGGMGGEGGNGEGGAGTGDREVACAEYCDIYYQAGCDSFDGGYYGTEANCATTCTGAIWELGEPDDAAGNSVHCRLTHANNALNAADAATTETHCGHARATPTGVCVP